MRLPPGSRLGRYEIVSPLGAGGMGEVYRARDPRLGREIAIKLLPGDVAADPERRARLEREARTVATLNHPNIVVLHSIEDEAGVSFLTMELVEGESLAHLVVPGGAPIARLTELGIVLADALAAAHAKGVVHRDLKPSNVMLTPEGRVKVLDFGLARPAAAAGAVSHGVAGATTATTMIAPHSEASLVSGTAPYMSPEQIRGAAVDARSDLFSLGILLYELATGRRPFTGGSPADITAAILRDTPTPPGALRTDLPATLAHAIERCLEKDPARRMPSAVELRAELERGRGSATSAATHAAQASLAPSKPAIPSIAVLPFENRGRAEDDEAFADGITEDVIAQLSKVKTLKVISRTSVMAFKGHTESLRDIAAKLDVAHVLEGSVRRAGDRVRIVAQLVDPETGQTAWAETYDRKLDDIFAIQTDVALQITAALQAELTPDERSRIRRAAPRDLQAYEYAMYGRQAFLLFNVDDYVRAIEFFERSIERDPTYAPAYAGMAMAMSEMGEHGVTDRKSVGERAKAAAAKAVELDPELSDAHLAYGHTRMVYDLDYAAAEKSFKRAIELSPSNALAYDIYGRMCAGNQRFDEAIALFEKAHELDPLVLRADLANAYLRAGRAADAASVAERNAVLAPDDARLRATLGWAKFRQGKQAEGIAELERAVALKPHENIWLAQLGEAYGLAGQAEKAHEVMRRLKESSRVHPVSAYHLAYIYTGLGDVEKAIDSLEESFARSDGALYGLKGSFLFEPLREHPRFRALIARLGV
jgi:serine/threonine protein kinase/tetratricopeptide (TPR) repeat protein